MDGVRFERTPSIAALNLGCGKPEVALEPSRAYGAARQKSAWASNEKLQNHCFSKLSADTSIYPEHSCSFFAEPALRIDLESEFFQPLGKFSLDIVSG